MYKFLAFSDIHASEEALDALRRLTARESFDAILCAGDLTNRGPVSYVKELLELFDKFYFVHGNMDSSIIIDEIRNHPGYLHGKKINFGEWNFVGLGGSNPTPFSTPSEYSEKQLEHFLELTEADYNSIVLSHPPPKGIFDVVGDGQHVGSTAVLDFIKKVKPLMLICGHIHENVGKTIVDETLIVKLPAAEELKAAKIIISDKIKVEFFSL
ncbi:MAG: metallophosphoesterase [Candidatus Micrarchaeota archaeon]|nr:metallophosphoesterase [Candidatus Micrarchaeota archaeon]